MFTFCSDDHLKGCPIPESEVANYNSSGNFEGFYRPGGTPIDYGYYDSAYLIPANSDIVLSLHYNPNGKAVTDVTKIGFTLAKGEPNHQLKMYTVPPQGGYMDRTTFRIPAGEPDWKAPPADAIFNVDAELALLSIHMHERGKVMTYTLTYPDGKSQIVLSEPSYNFNWQFTYELAETIKIPKGTRLHVDAWYDNSSNNPFNRDPNRDVYGGDQSWEEMMAPWIGLVLSGDFDPKKENVFTSNPD